GARLAGGQRRAEELHLHAPVVQVVLPVDRVAGALQDPAQGVAVGRPPAPAGVERAGGVGRHELAGRGAAAAEVEPGEAVRPRLDDVDEDVVQPRLPQVEVHEARAGDLHPLDVGGRGLLQVGDEVGGQLAGDAAVGLGGGEGDVGGPV